MKRLTEHSIQSISTRKGIMKKVIFLTLFGILVLFGNLPVWGQYFIHVTSPVAGDQWIGNSDHTITWTSNVDDPYMQFTVSYSLSGSGWTVIRSVPAGHVGTYSTGWTLPNPGSSACKVRIACAGVGIYTDSGSFNICGSQLAVSPTSNISSIGMQGGPFSPSSFTYSLTNPGCVNTSYSVSANQTWVTVSPTSGTSLKNSAETDVITVSLNANADSLTPGTYAATVTFTNLSNGYGTTTRTITLTVNSISIPQIERDALIALFNSTNGDGWTNKTGWKTPPLHIDGFAMPGTEGTWFSIGVSNNHVVSIIPYSNNLVGSIPNEIGNLLSLHYLDIHGNQLSGSIPTTIGNLSYLYFLSISDCQLTGTIPIQLGGLTALQYLYLRNNQLSGSIPPELGNLVNLKYLLLDRNQLNGSIPSEIGNLTQLITLYLYTNHLSGSIPTQIGNLSNLVELYLNGGNQLTGTIPQELGNLSKLFALYLNGNLLTGSIPSQLGNLANLTRLVLDNNQLTGSIPTQIGNLNKLEYLHLQNNQLTGPIPDQLGNLSNLIELQLHSNLLSGSIPAQIGNLTKLEYLHLYSNQLTGTIPAQLGGLSNLLSLYLSTNQLSGTIPIELGNLSKLQGLGIHSNQITGTIPNQLGTLSSLTDLNLANNQLSGAIPSGLGNLSQLTRLYLNGNLLTGSIPSQLGNLTNLQYLHLYSNQLTGTIPAQLGGLGNLLSLYLSTNQLSGTIPLELGNLSKLQGLGLHTNQITGTIPNQLGTLSNLTDLNLANNQLSGSIPSTHGNLTNLQYFSLQNNKLSGSIPTQIINLIALNPAGTNIGYNALHASDAPLIAFLNSKDADWASTQTIAPGNILATPVNSTTINLTWDMIPYTGDTGGYRIFVGTTSGGPYTFFQQTTDKLATSLPVTGLNPNTPYYFVITTRTDAHGTQQNIIDSENSTEASAATLPGSYTISGNAGIAGATLSYTDGSPKTATADGSGNYSFSVSYDWSGTVTPSYSGYSFTPANRTYTNVLSSQTSQDYTATPIAYTISGNAGAVGVTLSYTDGSPKTATSDGSGNYSFTVSYNWSGTVTPSLAGYTFTPANRTYANILSNQTAQDYTATAIRYNISGNAGIGGAILSYTDGSPKTATADSSGNYSFTVSYNWSGTVTPSYTGNSFSPADRIYTNVLSNQTSQNYTASPIRYTISGNAGIAGATLSYTDGTPKTATSDGGGNYSFTVSYNWSGTVTPSLTGYNFSPTNRTYTNVFSNQTSQDYSAALITFTVTFVEGAGGTITGTKVQTVNYGANASEVTAVANLGYHFINWTGAYSGTDNPLTITNVTSDLTITANFAINQYTVTFVEGAGGTITGSKVQTINHGDSATAVTAVADSSYHFVNWTGGYSGTDNPLTVTNVTSDLTITANFEINSYTISGTILVGVSPLAGVVMSGLPGSPATDASGVYSGTVTYNWSGTVTPTLAGYTFSPINRVYANVIADQTAQDYTAAVVVPPALDLTSPDGGEYWTLGTIKSITWTATNYSGTVRLVLYKDGAKLGNIATGISAAAGTYSWTVGQYSGGTGPAGSGYRIYLRSTDNTIIDPSATWFNLIAAAQLQVTSPNGGESWASGSQQAITWNPNGYSGTVRLILFSNTAKKGQIAANIPASAGTYLWTVGVTKYATVPPGSMYSVRLLATDASQQDYSDSPFAITGSGALVADHVQTELKSIPAEWLEAARWQQRLLVMSAGKDDPATLGLRLLGSQDPRLGVTTDNVSATSGLGLREALYQPKGSGFDLQEWRWSLEQAALESNATVVLVKADEAALRSGRLDAAGYIDVLRELAERLPGVKLVCSTASIDKADDLLEMFNRQVREYVLQTDGVLLDTADIESWHGGEQAVQDESPVRNEAYCDDSGLPSAENLSHQGAAMWWLLARLTGWEGDAAPLTE